MQPTAFSAEAIEGLRCVFSCIDNTTLEGSDTHERIQSLCQQSIQLQDLSQGISHVAAVCVYPVFVKQARQLLQGSGIRVASVAGAFPSGQSPLSVKLLEVRYALDQGADEIDMVINIGMLKAGEYDFVLDEIKQIKAACGGKLLKVIIETCLLTDEEKIKMCNIVSESGADFIKTSTGFSKGGATFDDIKLFRQYVDPKVKIKAAGGISSLEDAEKFIELGASRLGTSRVVKAVKEREKE